MIISKGTHKKNFEKNPTSFHDNNTQQTRNRKELLQPKKKHPKRKQKHTANIILISERLKKISPKIRNKMKMSAFATSI